MGQSRCCQGCKAVPLASVWLLVAGLLQTVAAEETMAPVCLIQKHRLAAAPYVGNLIEEGGAAMQQQPDLPFAESELPHNEHAAMQLEESNPSHTSDVTLPV